MKARPHNTGFASGGVKCKIGDLCFYSISVQVDSFCSETRPKAKPENVIKDAAEDAHYRAMS
jgi:hypothetical protein